MNSSIEKVLGQLPYVLKPSAVPRLDIEEIENALAEVRKAGIANRNSARVAAFAWYSGVDSEGVLALFRAAGTVGIVRSELKAHKANPSKLADIDRGRMFRVGSSRSLPSELGESDLGWAVAILAVATEADFQAVVESLDPKYDPSRVASLYALSQPYIAFPNRRPLIAKLLDIDDKVSREIAITLLLRWIEDEIVRGDQQFPGVFEEVAAERSCRAVVLGALLEGSDKFRGAPFGPEINGRAALVQQLIDSAGKRIVADGSAVNAILKDARYRDLQVLAAMSRWRDDPGFARAASKTMTRRAGERLETEFGSRLTETDQEALLRPFAGAWLIEPLVQVLVHDGIESDIFRGYFDGLATDSLSKMTRYKTFLIDRQRAIVLLAVTGRVARERNDSQLLLAVKEAAAELTALPAGTLEILNENASKELNMALGFEIPTK